MSGWAVVVPTACAQLFPVNASVAFHSYWTIGAGPPGAAAGAFSSFAVTVTDGMLPSTEMGNWGPGGSKVRVTLGDVAIVRHGSELPAALE